MAGEAGEGEVVAVHQARADLTGRDGHAGGCERGAPGRPDGRERGAAARVGRRSGRRRGGCAAWLRARGDAADVRTRRVRPAGAGGRPGSARRVAVGGSLLSVVLARRRRSAAPRLGLLVLAMEAAGWASPARLALPAARDVARRRGRAPAHGPALVVCAPFGSPRARLGVARRRLGAWPALGRAGRGSPPASPGRRRGRRVAGRGAARADVVAAVVATAALDAGLAGWGPGEAAAGAVARGRPRRARAASRRATLSPALLLVRRRAAARRAWTLAPARSTAPAPTRPWCSSSARSARRAGLGRAPLAAARRRGARGATRWLARRAALRGRARRAAAAGDRRRLARPGRESRPLRSATRSSRPRSTSRSPWPTRSTPSSAARRAGGACRLAGHSRCLDRRSGRSAGRARRAGPRGWTIASITISEARCRRSTPSAYSAISSRRSAARARPRPRSPAAGCRRRR